MTLKIDSLGEPKVSSLLRNCISSRELDSCQMDTVLIRLGFPSYRLVKP